MSIKFDPESVVPFLHACRRLCGFVLKKARFVS
jgi:hypothetical protein